MQRCISASTWVHRQDLSLNRYGEAPPQAPASSSSTPFELKDAGHFSTRGSRVSTTNHSLPPPSLPLLGVLRGRGNEAGPR
jgi:hypothetical protein